MTSSSDEVADKKVKKNKAWFKHITSDVLQAAAASEAPQNLALPLPIHQQPQQSVDMFAAAEAVRNRQKQ